ncbi:GrdX family protein [Enorma burkinafasonensis]|uniref:GrdX family protein n=1 Tax=Enorma burkinafasonensis TaxID=2590867 RepID=UPI0011A81ADD|nr:GrdX family protein [Enorma burkinafasonensis]
MDRTAYLIMTNNPLVVERLGGTHEAEFLETSYEGLLLAVRDKVHEGHALLSHPLAGSVKPNETPYRSIMVSCERCDAVDARSLSLIERAIEACRKFEDKTSGYGERALKDFQLIDWTLLESGLDSADA